MYKLKISMTLFAGLKYLKRKTEQLQKENWRNIGQEAMQLCFILHQQRIRRSSNEIAEKSSKSKNTLGYKEACSSTMRTQFYKKLFLATPISACQEEHF